MNWTMIYKKQVIGLFSGKSKSTLTQNNKHEKWFCPKKLSNNSLPLTPNKTEVWTCQSQKHIGLILDERLNFTERMWRVAQFGISHYLAFAWTFERMRIHANALFYLRLHELAWHSNGSMKCQTLECNSNG